MELLILVLPSLQSAVRPSHAPSAMPSPACSGHSPALWGPSTEIFLPELAEAADVPAEPGEVLTSQLLSSLLAQQPHCPLPAPHFGFPGFLPRLGRGCGIGRDLVQDITHFENLWSLFFQVLSLLQQTPLPTGSCPSVMSASRVECLDRGKPTLAQLNENLL